MIAHLPAIDADVSLTTRRIVLYTFDILRTVLRTAHPLTERILRRNIKTSRIYGYLQLDINPLLEPIYIWTVSIWKRN